MFKKSRPVHLFLTFAGVKKVTLENRFANELLCSCLFLLLPIASGIIHKGGNIDRDIISAVKLLCLSLRFCQDIIKTTSLVTQLSLHKGALIRQEKKERKKELLLTSVFRPLFLRLTISPHWRSIFLFVRLKCT